MSYPDDVEAELQRLKSALVRSWESNQKSQQGETESLRLELAREYEEKAQLNEQYQSIRRELEAIRLQQVDTQIEMGELRGQRDQHQQKAVETGKLQDCLNQAEEEIARLRAELEKVREQLHLEAEQSSRLTLEMVDLKLAQEAERRLHRGLSDGPPRLNLPDLIPDERPLDESRLLQKLAYEDAVTGLPNFRLGERYLQVELTKAMTVALVMLRAERLDEIKKLLGTELSDELLNLFSQRMSKGLRQEDALVRGPGDDFWVIMPTQARGPLGLKTMTDTVTRTVSGLFEALKVPFHVDEQKIQLVMACGVCCSQGQEEVDQVIERALLALAAACGKGGNRLVNFQPELEKPARKRNQLIPLLRQALHRGQFELRFQPIVELKTGLIKGVESLLRWNHPLEGILEPSTFLEAACKSGVIVGIGDWVMGNVCALSQAYRSIYWSFNVSAQELIQADFTRRLTKAMEAAKLSRPEFIVVEVSEDQLAGNDSRLLAVIKELRGWKVQLAIDDFSFDAFSMKRLQSRGVNYVKLSHEVTHNLDQVLVRNLVRGAVLAADGLGAKVVAKGIENQGHLDLALENGCHWGQGHLLCSPLPWPELEEKLKNRAPRI
ncbi:EAL domain-containing protein [bacterium]|nr:EAL domain-containing protein [bacterium]